jgi:hypothetical protein
MLVTGRERAYISWFFQNFAYNPRAVSEADVDEYARCLAQPGALRAGFEYYRAAGQDAVDFAAAARAPLSCPVLALGGERSIGAAVKLCMQQVAGDVRGGVMERCGHWIAEAQPQALLDELAHDKAFDRPVVTELVPLANYWPAEDYHQDFFEHNPHQGYCMAVAAPKVAKFRKTFARLVK